MTLLTKNSQETNMGVLTDSTSFRAHEFSHSFPCLVLLLKLEYHRAIVLCVCFLFPSLVFFVLWQIFSLSWLFMTFMFLRSISQVFHRMFFSLGLFDVFSSWLDRGYRFLERTYRGDMPFLPHLSRCAWWSVASQVMVTFTTWLRWDYQASPLGKLAFSVLWKLGTKSSCRWA